MVIMHEYSIDTERNKILFVMALISITISGLATSLINKWIQAIPFIEFTVSIASMAVFGLIYTLFDKFFWKWKWLKKFGIVQTPNLNGTWEGECRSSFYEFENPFIASLSIEQTWSKICISGQFNYSKSSSYTASIKVQDGGGTKLFYSYKNDKNPEHYQKSISDHKGYGRLTINELNGTLEGSYFNDPSNNSNHGILNLKRTS